MNSFELRIDAKRSHQMMTPFLQPEQVPVIGLAEPHSRSDQGFQNQREVESTLADDFQYLGYGHLLRPGFVKLRAVRLELLLELGNPCRIALCLFGHSLAILCSRTGPGCRCRHLVL
jgi:hypothetical protein